MFRARLNGEGEDPHVMIYLYMQDARREKREPFAWAGGRLARSDRPPWTSTPISKRQNETYPRSGRTEYISYREPTMRYYVTVWGVLCMWKHLEQEKETCVGCWERASKQLWAAHVKTTWINYTGSG